MISVYSRSKFANFIYYFNFETMINSLKNIYPVRLDDRDGVNIVNVENIVDDEIEIRAARTRYNGSRG